jgi:predicted Zn-dependent protease with MMP-like domain
VVLAAKPDLSYVDGFGMISTQRFEELVEEALDSIPDEFWAVVDNLAVTVAEWPSQAQLYSVGVGPGGLLLGLYEGVPLTERSSHYGLVAPDKVTIFRGPILRVCPPDDEDAVRRQVRRTVLHEVAHHFGISDARLHELGAY